MRRSAQILELLRTYESRNVTFLEPDGRWPIVWQRAHGTRVWDAEGKRYLDLTAAFAVAAAGHANPRVVRAGQRQMATLLHAMGDVHPHSLKAELARALSRITFERWTKASGSLVVAAGLSPHRRTAAAQGKVVFSNSGFEAVETALKTALLATGKPGVIAFQGAYHGLGYGALNTTQRRCFRAPFLPQLRGFGSFVPFPTKAADLETVEASLGRVLRRKSIGAVLVEPIQGRGGIQVPPAAFLPLLRRVCDEHGALLVADEIFTGFGRTGRWFACEHTGTVPDLICLGKALTGGFPLSACVGRADVMDAAWPASTGEAIHTSTFLGHPVGCAMALAHIAEITERRLVERSAALGCHLLAWLESCVDACRNACRARRDLRSQARGVGLMAGLELRRRNGAPATRLALSAIREMLHRGFILLPEGEHANVISFTPPLTIARTDLKRAVDALINVLAGDAGP